MNYSAATATLGTAVVTGASAGIGAGYADRLAQRGYDLILAARRGDRLERMATALADQYGVKVSAVVVDLGDAGELESFAGRIAADPTITLLVNNAGTSKIGPFAATPVEAATAMNDLNVGAVVRLTRAVLLGLLERKRGTIVNIGSVLGFKSMPGTAVYSAGKAYAALFTRALQEEVAGTGVTVQLVAPAATRTELWDIAGVSLDAFPPEAVMTVDTLVNASLAGLDMGEAVTMPAVEALDPLVKAHDDASQALLDASNSGRAAGRYADAQGMTVPG